MAWSGAALSFKSYPLASARPRFERGLRCVGLAPTKTAALHVYLSAIAPLTMICADFSTWLTADHLSAFQIKLH